MRYLAITVDTEADWARPEENRIESVEGIPYLQDVCAEYGMIPTYLVTYEMAVKEEAVSVIKPYSDRGLCEIGHHLHIWTTPPFEDCNSHGVDERWIYGIQSEIPDQVFEQKMGSLHDAIRTNYGIRPRSHRAGRWAIDTRTMVWLERHGYAVDSSVCPYISWSKVKGINQFISTDTFASPNHPYYPDSEDIARATKGGNRAMKILEVPVTGVKGDILSRFSFRGISRLRSVLHRFGYRGTGNMSFRPSSDIPPKVFEDIVHKVFSSDASFINFMFHSPELTVGTSPYSQDKASTAALRQRIEVALRTAAEYGLKGIALSEVGHKMTPGGSSD
ncbi:MAG: hypothetical protein PVJ42_02045 [bacterium]|jgi:hypothetical protein